MRMMKIKTKQEIEQILEALENDYKTFVKEYCYGDDINMSFEFFREITSQKRKVIDTIKLVLNEEENGAI